MFLPFVVIFAPLSFLCLLEGGKVENLLKMGNDISLRFGVVVTFVVTCRLTLYLVSEVSKSSYDLSVWMAWIWICGAQIVCLGNFKGEK